MSGGRETGLRRRPTRAAAAVTACGVLLILMSGTAQAAWLAVVGALVLGVTIGSIPVRHRLAGAVVEITPPGRPRVGDAVLLEVRVSAPSHRLPVLRLELEGAPFGDVALLVEAVPAGADAAGVLSVDSLTRGVHAAQQVTLRTGAPFGLLRSRLTVAAPCPVEVGAELVDVPAALLRAVAGVNDDTAAERRRGAGDEVHAVREYRSGDALRDVHWRSTARAGRLVVREYEHPVPTRSAVAVAGGSPGPGFEALVSAAASFAHAWWRAGEPVDVIRLDPQGAPVVLRGASQHGLHSWSAAVEPVAGDLRVVSRELLEEVRPTAAVLAVGPGADGVAAACSELLAAGCSVLLLTPAGLADVVPAGVTHRVVEPGGDLVSRLVGATR